MLKFVSILAVLMPLFASTAYAANPTKIQFTSNEKTFLGTEYKMYAVRCSDGRKRKISAWQKGRKWCAGNSDSGECMGNQMQIAKFLCK